MEEIDLRCCCCCIDDDDGIGRVSMVKLVALMVVVVLGQRFINHDFCLLHAQCGPFGCR